MLKGAGVNKFNNGEECYTCRLSAYFRVSWIAVVNLEKTCILLQFKIIDDQVPKSNYFGARPYDNKTSAINFRNPMTHAVTSLYLVISSESTYLFLRFC